MLVSALVISADELAATIAIIVRKINCEFEPQVPPFPTLITSYLAFVVNEFVYNKLNDSKLHKEVQIISVTLFGFSVLSALVFVFLDFYGVNAKEIFTWFHIPLCLGSIALVVMYILRLGAWLKQDYSMDKELQGALKQAQ
jgi:hypothetical protein